MNVSRALTFLTTPATVTVSVFAVLLPPVLARRRTPQRVSRPAYAGL